MDLNSPNIYCYMLPIPYSHSFKKNELSLTEYIERGKHFLKNSFQNEISDINFVKEDKTAAILVFSCKNNFYEVHFENEIAIKATIKS